MIHLLNIVKRFFNNLIIIKNNKTENRYRADNNKKHININNYKEKDEDKNKYEKNQGNKKNKLNDDNNNDENSIIIKIIQLPN